MQGMVSKIYHKKSKEVRAEVVKASITDRNNTVNLLKTVTCSTTAASVHAKHKEVLEEYRAHKYSQS